MPATRKAIVAVVVFLSLSLLLWKVASQSRKHGLSAGKPLPQSIEEFRAALNQPDFGMFFLDFSHELSTPPGDLTLDNVKLRLNELLGRRTSTLGSTKSMGNLVADYSAVAGKRVSFGRSWLNLTNEISYDDSIPKTRRETLKMIEGILRTNGGFIFPLNSTNVVLLTDEDLKTLGQPLPGDGK